MTLRDYPAAIESDDSTLLQYESLRLQALNWKESFSLQSLGLALFIRQEMPAWIEVCQRCMPANLSREKQVKMPAFTYGTTSEMIKVMANITLFNLEEALL